MPTPRPRRRFVALMLALALPALAIVVVPVAVAGTAQGTQKASTSTTSTSKTATSKAANGGKSGTQKTAAKKSTGSKKKAAQKPRANPPLGVATFPADGPRLYSRAAVVFDPAVGRVIYDRRSDAVLPIASITKLMTALVVVEAGQPLYDEVTITREEAEATSRSTSRLPVGASLTRAELLQLALMSSENRAAYALCRSYPGGYGQCIAAMRRKAAELGMVNTRFTEPTGLSSENVSSPQDLAKLVRAAGRVPLIQEYSTAPSLIVPLRGAPVEFRNTDRLVLDPSFGVRVSKTGFINEAGRCLVLQVELASRPFVIVLLNAEGPAARTADARALRRWLETKYTAQEPLQAAVRESDVELSPKALGSAN
jgi:serine-type D-Ala-D-Ala endopeptidase (penicillin-binding protein 7)